MCVTTLELWKFLGNRAAVCAIVVGSSARATSRRGYVCGYNIKSTWKHVGGTTANLMSEWVVNGVLHMTPLRGSTSNQLYIAPHSAG